ncbi:MAG: DUF3108 domain-containing protein [Sedimenticola sp.]|nr:DUF3108 domain-containing protein [Sedimenticola sp.]
MRLAPMRMPRALCIAFCLLLASGLPQASELPLKPYSAQYRLSMGQFVIGNVEISLELADGRYHYRAFTAPVGLAAVFRKDQITEQSEGRLDNSRIVPVRYHYQHKKPKKNRQVKLEFDWTANLVTNRTANSHWTMQVPPGTQDKFSQQLALMLALCRGEREAEFQVADGGLLKTYRYTEVNRERVRTAAGEHDTIKLARNKGERPSRASLWFDPTLNCLPVKIAKHEEDGDYVMELVGVTWKDPS